jgi:signal peptidase I
VRLEPDEFFLLGDNSDHSTDSREYGPVKVERLIGRAAWIVWPPSRMGRVVLHPEAPGEACEP